MKYVRIAALVFLMAIQGCVGWSYVKGDLYLPDRTRPVQSDSDRSGYGACQRFLKGGATDMRYSSCPN